jgi:hypothetical protein
MVGESSAAVRRVCRRIDAFDEAGLQSPRHVASSREALDRIRFGRGRRS